MIFSPALVTRRHWRKAQLLMYPFGSPQERIERGSHSVLRDCLSPAATRPPMPYAAHCESAW